MNMHILKKKNSYITVLVASCYRNWVRLRPSGPILPLPRCSIQLFSAMLNKLARQIKCCCSHLRTKEMLNKRNVEQFIIQHFTDLNHVTELNGVE